MGSTQGTSATSPQAKLSAEQTRELRDLLDALLRLEEAFHLAGDHAPFVCVPSPSLRVRHPT
jgi:hypothetical protein